MATTKELMQARMAELAAEKDSLKQKTEGLKADREKFNAAASEANASALDLTEKIHAIERPRLLEINRELSALAQALGGLRLNA